MPPSRIRIFWDLGSCPPPPDYTSSAEILKDVRRFTSNFGAVNNIKAYWDRTKTHQLNESLYATLPSMGVNLTDCSSMPGYSDDAISKMLIVDTLISAMDDPGSDEKDILMIISGDESVLYPISLLMFRNFAIFLVAPDENNVHGSRATRVFRWEQDVLGYWPGLDPEQPMSTLGLMSPPQPSVASRQHSAPSRPHGLSAVSAMTPKSKDHISLPSSHYPTPPVLSPPTSAPANLGNHAAEFPATAKPSAPSRWNEIRAPTNLGNHSAEPPATAKPSAPSKQNEIHAPAKLGNHSAESPATAKPSAPSKQNEIHAPAKLGNHSAESPATAKPSAPSKQNEIHAPAKLGNHSAESPATAKPSAPSKQNEIRAPANLGNHSAESPAIAKPSAPSRQNEIRPSQVPQPVPNEPVQQVEEDDWGGGGGWNTSGGWTMSGNDWGSDPVTPAPKPEVKPKQPERELKPEQKPQATQPPPKKSQSGSNSTRAQAPTPLPPKKPQSNSNSTQARASNPSKMPQPSVSNAAFDRLIHILRGTEDRSMRRAQLGEHLAKCQGLYSSAGVNSFGEYIALAAKHNIVVLLGEGGLQKVELKNKI